MKEDNNIKPLISAILNLSLKLSKCQNIKSAPKAAPKAVPKAVPKAARRNMKGGGSTEFFE
jgi:hypothetical protein